MDEVLAKVIKMKACNSNACFVHVEAYVEPFGGLGVNKPKTIESDSCAN